MAAYESLLAEIIPMVPSCTDTLIEQNIRAAVIELCEKSKVYQAELDPITTVANLYEYDLEPPSGTVVHEIVWVTHNGIDLEPSTTALIEQRKPKWRIKGYEGTPEFFVKQSPSMFYLVPVPSATEANSLLVRAILKPTHRSTSCSDDVMNDYRDTIINGALYRLLRIPGREWTDYPGAQVYGSLFLEGLATAEGRALQKETRIARKVRYGGAGGIYRISDRGYSNR